MNHHEPSVERVLPLIEAACLGTISPRQTLELQDLLHGDAELQRVYLEYCRMHSELRCLCRASATNHAVMERIAAETVSDSTEHKIYVDRERPTASFPASIFGLLGGAYQEHHVVFSYMVAVVCLSLAAIVGSMIYVSTGDRNGLIVSGDSAPNTLPEIQNVGRITGMKDCRWSAPGVAPLVGAYVPLGRKYLLDAGLLEITYESGARVILEGPCTYRVVSTAGGYLGLGKLTARVESAKPQAASNPQSPIPNPLFSVTTPTAVVTDLGTEFGVEVNEQGDTTSHVFRGSVKVQVVSVKANKSTVVLHENESARVEKSKDGGGVRLILDGTAIDPAKFTKRLIKPTRAISFSGSYDGSYDPYSVTPPAGQSTWRHGTATLTPMPNDDNGVSAPGVANFNDLTADARVSIYRLMGTDTFANQANNEYTFSVRLKLNSEDMTTTSSLALFSLGFRDEWNGGANYGKVVMLGWFYGNANDGNNPGLWLVEHHVLGSARRDAVKINNVNYFDDAWHTYRVDKVLEGGVAKIKVYVDGLLKVKISYDDLPAASSGDNGFGYFGTTVNAARVTLDYIKYGVYAPQPEIIVKE